MDKIFLSKVNETYFQVNGDYNTLIRMSDYFSDYAPNYRFHPAYKFGTWDGIIRYFNLRYRLIYVGLYDEIMAWGRDNNVQIDLDFEMNQTEFSLQEAYDFFATLKLPFQPRDYQVKAFVKCVRERRKLILSPTASGKSFIIYLLSRYFETQGMRQLLIVPQLGLVKQIRQNFKDYDLDETFQDKIYTISKGVCKENISEPCVVALWQSIHRKPDDWFTGYDAIQLDEAHGATANCLKAIIERSIYAKYRLGFTGTLNGAKSSERLITGLVGPTERMISTKELMDQGDVSELKIKSIVLKYPEAVRKQCAALRRAKKFDYPTEKAFLFTYKFRNNFIKNLAQSLDGNSLVLFSSIEHGKLLHEMIQTENKYLVYGKVEVDEREEIRKIINTHEKSITVASLKTFSTGVDIPNLNNIIFASPSKARITVMQSIGRGLRRSATKSKCTLFDIADDLSWKSYKNTTLKHYDERLLMYIQEKFNNKSYSVEIK